MNPTRFCCKPSQLSSQSLRVWTKYNPPRLLLLFMLLFGHYALSNDEALVRITPINDGDLQFMDKQRKTIDEIARRYLGARLRQDRVNDLDILQKILNKRLVRKDQKLELQAMGVIIGDLYVKEMGVRWVVYRDQYGRSRALQWAANKNVLFPITMISRRVEVGIQVDVNEIYSNGLTILKRQKL